MTGHSVRDCWSGGPRQGTGHSLKPLRGSARVPLSLLSHFWDLNTIMF